MSTIDVTEHLRLVDWAARKSKAVRWAARGDVTLYRDIIQAGRMGLMKAAEKFDPERGVKFATYARWSIDAYMKTYCYESINVVRVPRNSQVKMWREGRPAQRRAVSLDTGFTTSDQNEGFCVLDFLGFRTQQEDERPDTDHLHARVRSALRSLPAREAAVLHGRFFDDRSLQELGDEFGVSRERIRQIQAEALQKLKQYFNVQA